MTPRWAVYQPLKSSSWYPRRRFRLGSSIVFPKNSSVRKVLSSERPIKDPLRLAPNFRLVYATTRLKFGANLSGSFMGRSDDSTFLTDEFFGNTMLLPNRNLLRGYQLLDFSGWYTAHRGVIFYASVGNLLSQHYQPVFGYPALPFTFRSGVRVALGGDEWKK